MLAWPAALNLRERLALLRSQQTPAMPVDVSLAQRRFARWQKEKVFAEDGFPIERRLAEEGITESEFLALLGTSPAELTGHLESPPKWAAAVERSYGSLPDAEVEQAIRKSGETGGKAAPFGVAAAGLMVPARQALRAGMESLQKNFAYLPFDPSAIEALLLGNVVGLLSGMLGRTLVLELNVARMQNQLSGTTPEERFRSFLSRLTEPEATRALWEEYPVLARQIVLSLEQWAATSIELLERLVADWPQIQRQFSPQVNPGLVVSIKSAGDRHHQGRTVSILEFQSGLRLVYKPRPLAMDVQFQRLLEWINQRCAQFSFRTLNILARHDYGWVGFVESQPCDSQEGVRLFYRRQGGCLAILYLVHATDFHHENLIACGDHPVLVDLETLFHPNLFLRDEQDPLFFASEQLSESVYRIGLLPFRFSANQEQPEGAEISGIGGKGGQKTPYPIAAWEGHSTDEMRLVRKRIEMPAQKNRPSLQGEEVNALEYLEDIIAGFTSMYRFLEQHREELLAPDSPLAAFADVPARCIARASQVYGTLLSESYHPNLLRDALDRERLFDDLWAETDSKPVLRKLIDQEREDLWSNDIPVFISRPGSPHLWASSGMVIENCLQETPLEVVRRRLKQMGSEDLKRQTWLIRAAMTALAIEKPPSIHHRPSSSLPVAASSPEDFLEMATQAGAYLLETAIRGPQESIAWINLDSVLEIFWELTPAGLDLYSGISGIGLFLAYLGSLTGESRFTSAAEEAVVIVSKSLKTLKPNLRVPVGAFAGFGGAIYFLTHCGVLWNRPDLFDKAEDLAQSLARHISEDRSFDVVSGSAGLIAVLLGLHQHRSSDAILALATQCGDRLAQQAQRMPQGIGWSIRPDFPPLTGFSHGSAGIAWALNQLAAVAREPRFRQLAVEALLYERSLFSAAEQNWPDLRKASGGEPNVSYAIAWCHGAPGIALGRALMLKHYQDEQIHAEIAAAVKTTLRRELGGNDSLCHGDLGNHESLLHAAQAIRDSELNEQARAMATRILTGIRERGWKSGVPMAVETPGLMVGVAGIGYGLLRLAQPLQVPSVLALAPPVFDNRG